MDGRIVSRMDLGGIEIRKYEKLTQHDRHLSTASLKDEDLSIKFISVKVL